jgi:hypothetical protein
MRLNINDDVAMGKHKQGRERRIELATLRDSERTGMLKYK